MDFSQLTDEQMAVAGKIIKEAEARGINPDFVLPMVMAESGFGTKKTSPKGAMGVMQLTPSAAKEVGVDPENTDENIAGGLMLIQRYMNDPRLGGDPAKIIAAYNAGPNHKFFETGKIEDLPDETVSHLSKVAGFSGGELNSPFLKRPDQEDTTEIKIPENRNDKVEVSDDDHRSLKAAAIGALAGGTLGAGKMALNSVIRPAPMTADQFRNIVQGADESQKTPGAKWGEKVTGHVKPGVQSVVEAARDYNRAMPQGKVSSQMAKRWGIPTGEPLIDRLINKPVMPPPPGPLERVMSNPVATGMLVGGGLAGNINEAGERYRRGDYPGAAIAGAGAVGSGLYGINTWPTKVIGGGLALSSPAALMLLDKMRERQKQQGQQTEDRPMLGMPQP